MSEISLISKAYELGRRFRPVHAAMRAWKKHVPGWIANFFRVLGRGTVRMGAARGFFSGANPAPGSGELILPGQQVPPPPKGSLREKAWQGDRYQPWPVFWSRYRNARLVSPSHALLNNEKRLMVESVWGEAFARTDPAYNYCLLPPATRLEGPWTNVTGRWMRTGYYHWLMDSLPRLALLGKFPAETRILIPANIYPSCVESLELLGIAGRCRPAPEKHFLIDDYYFSATTAMTGCDSPYAIRWLRDTLLPYADPAGPVHEKLYITRRGKTRGIVNEQEVIDFFAARGWTIAHLEDLTLVKQMWLFSRVRFVCGLHGAAFTNLLWSSPGCRALELFPSNFINGCYEAIAAYTGVRHSHLISPGAHDYTITVDMKTLAASVDAMEA